MYPDLLGNLSINGKKLVKMNSVKLFCHAYRDQPFEFQNNVTIVRTMFRKELNHRKPWNSLHFGMMITSVKG